MSAWELVRHQVAAAGTVTDTVTGNPLRGVDVTLTDGPAAFLDMIALRAVQAGKRWSNLAERPDRTRTRADGHYHFMDLPNGGYTLEAAWPGAGSRFAVVTTTFTITRNPDETINRVAADISLDPTTLSGTITDKDSTDPVVMAEVRLQGSGERAFSDSSGHYVLAGLEVGTRTVLVSAQNYESAAQTVALTPAGSTQTVDFLLTSK